MKIEIINQQKIKRINLKNLESQIKAVLSFLKLKKSKISILFCNDYFIKKLHKKYFNDSSVTDVITFPLKDEFEREYLGELVISVERAVKVADKLKVKWPDELLLYIVHGILHLTGYKDQTAKERQALEKKQAEVLEKVK